MNGKVTILLGAVGIALAITTIVIFVNYSSLLNEKDDIILNLQDQIQNLKGEKYTLQNQVDALESEYQDYQSTHQHSDTQYWDYVNTHEYTNEEISELTGLALFRFYYVTFQEQKFGVYNLEAELSGFVS